MMYTNTLLRKVRSYAPLTCYLNEFIEREINLSLVRQMRHKYGIEMPEFFARFKPRCWVTVRTPEQEIKLNACKYPDRWAPVMLGQAMYAYDAMPQPLANPMIENSMGEQFMQLWKELVRCRNISDHAQYAPGCIMDYHLLSSQHEAFSLMLHKYLGKMMSIKAELME